LWFRGKPNFTGNKSGITSPGVQIALVPCEFGVPLLGQTGVTTQLNWCRVEWGAINVSADATLSTRFRWETPQIVSTGQTYAVVTQYDGDEDYLLWYNKTGDLLVGTSTVSSGTSSSSAFSGKLYSYIGSTGDLIGTGLGYSNSTLISNSSIIASVSSQVQSSIQLTQKDLLTAWSPVSGTNLMFVVSCARYMHHGIPIYSNSALMADASISIWGHAPNNVSIVSNNVLRVASQATCVEFINYDKSLSVDTPAQFGDVVYQKQPYFSGGKGAPLTLSVANNDVRVYANASFTYPNGAAFSWSNLFTAANKDNQWIIATSLNHDGAGAHRVNVRALRGATISGNYVTVTEPFTFTNTAANFFVSPLARLSSQIQKYGAGGAGAPIAKTSNILVLSGSTANDVCRFTNNAIDIDNVAITANGTGYNNSDILTISGFENVGAEVAGGYNATANVRTNGSGAITSLVFTNTGCGFVNSAAVTYAFSNNSGGSSNGSGATLTLAYGSTLLVERTNGNTYYKGITVTNLDAMQVVPLLALNQPSGTSLGVTFETLYHSESSANTYSTRHYYVNDNPSTTDFSVINGALHNFVGNSIPTIPSRSNQFVIRYANGYVANSSVIGSSLSNSVVYFVDVTSNNDYTAVSFGNTYFSSQFAKYIINNDYTNEHTNYGNCWSKTIEKTVGLANGMMAEDLQVFITGFRPLGTDFKVYARIYNSSDSDAFVNKDYTLLTQTDGFGLYSNPADETDEYEYTYSFPMYPNTDYTSPGSITTTLSSNAIVGSNTNFTANLAVGDLVKLYQPLLPNNYMVASVGTITDNTHITLTTTVSNNGIVGSGLKLDRINYPHQAFHDILNSNVVTYFNSNSVPYTTYDTFQIKVCFISNNSMVVPKMDDVRGVAVTS
jgi:hypothetical protein